MGACEQRRRGSRRYGRGLLERAIRGDDDDDLPRPINLGQRSIRGLPERPLGRLSKSRAPDVRTPGDYRYLAIPVPIPNTVVKQAPPMIVRMRESR
jgi:hypothetical protein